MKNLLFTENGLYCPQGDFYIDPWKPVPKAFITHGHSDHARRGNEKYICHRLTVPVLKYRLGDDISVYGIEYGEKLTVGDVKVSFFPAGHVIGSAQIKIAYRDEITVVSGDYKLADDGLSAAFEPVKCHNFITESTFGLPIYKWKSQEQIYAEMQEWAAGNSATGKASIFIAYSLGKAQRVLSALAPAGEVYVHRSIGNINELFNQAGVQLPDYHIVPADNDQRNLAGKMVIIPPSIEDTQFVKKIPQHAVAACSGWMQVRGNRRWRSLDAGFAISDHADWEGLLAAVRATGCEQVYVTHGFQATFARYLNEIGIPASEVSTAFGEEDEGIPEDIPTAEDVIPDDQTPTE